MSHFVNWWVIGIKKVRGNFITPVVEERMPRALCSGNVILVAMNMGESSGARVI